MHINLRNIIGLQQVVWRGGRRETATAVILPTDLHTSTLSSLPSSSSYISLPSSSPPAYFITFLPESDSDREEEEDSC